MGLFHCFYISQLANSDGLSVLEGVGHISRFRPPERWSGGALERRQRRLQDDPPASAKEQRCCVLTAFAFDKGRSSSESGTNGKRELGSIERPLTFDFALS